MDGTENVDGQAPTPAAPAPEKTFPERVADLEAKVESALGVVNQLAALAEKIATDTGGVHSLGSLLDTLAHQFLGVGRN